MESSALAYFVVLSWYYIGGLEERHTKPQSGKVESRRDSNYMPPE
jgi:hypothetical protein